MNFQMPNRYDARGGPLYWRFEVSGVLIGIINKYLNGEDLAEEEFGFFRDYLVYWADAPVWRVPPDLRDGFKALIGRGRELKNVSEARVWLRDALEFGIDPL